MAWMRAVTARLEGSVHISVGVVYNTPPTPLGIGSDHQLLGRRCMPCSTPIPRTLKRRGSLSKLPI